MLRTAGLLPLLSRRSLSLSSAFSVVVVAPARQCYRDHKKVLKFTIHTLRNAQQPPPIKWLVVFLKVVVWLFCLVGLVVGGGLLVCCGCVWVCFLVWWGGPRWLFFG